MSQTVALVRMHWLTNANLI